jgi:transposase
MRPTEEARWLVLVPFDAREGLNLSAAGKRSGKSKTTVRNWCGQHGGVWVVCKVA